MQCGYRLTCQPDKGNFAGHIHVTNCWWRILHEYLRPQVFEDQHRSVLEVIVLQKLAGDQRRAPLGAVRGRQREALPGDIELALRLVEAAAQVVYGRLQRPGMR